MNKLHYNIKISGRVQGVWFRKYTVKFAIKSGVTGFVKNDMETSVYVEAEGDIIQLTEFIKLLNKGSPLSKVDRVTFENGNFKNFELFEISY